MAKSTTSGRPTGARRDLIDEVVQALITSGGMPEVMTFAADPMGLVAEIIGTDDGLTAGTAKRAALIARERGASTEAAERLASALSPGALTPRSAKVGADGFMHWEADERPYRQLPAAEGEAEHPIEVMDETGTWQTVDSWREQKAAEQIERDRQHGVWTTLERADLQAIGRVLHDGRVPVLGEMQRLRAVGVGSYQKRFSMSDIAAEAEYWSPTAVKARKIAEADAAGAARRAMEAKTKAAMSAAPDFAAMYPKMHASLADGETKAKAKKPFEMQPLSHGGSTRVTV